LSIYRGAGGAGDAVADSSSEALLIRELVVEAQADADAAAASATAAAGSASAASTSASNAATSATNAANSAASINVSLFAQKANNLSDLTSASTARTNLGLGTAATTASTAYATAAQGTSADTAFSDRLKWDGGATNLVASTGRTSLGLGSIATQNSSSVSITGGLITGITDLAVADGGTGASTLTANNVLIGNGTSPVSFVAPSTTGNVLTSNGTTWTSSTPSLGKLLQVVSQTFQGTQFSTTSNSMVATGFGVSITPTSASSKILVSISTSLSWGGSGMGIAVYRGTTSVWNPSISDSFGAYGALFSSHGIVSIEYLDSPSTTSSTTYNLYMASRSSSTSSVNITASVNNGGTTITLMEIAA